MEDQRVLDKFQKLHEDDEFNTIFGESEPKPTEASAEPAKPKGGHEEGKPAEMGDFGTALKNVEEFGQVPGYTDTVKGAREASKPTPEELAVSKSGSTMDKLKALPKGVGKAFSMAASNAIPATVGEAGLFGAAGKIIKGIGGGIRALGQTLRGEGSTAAKPVDTTIPKPADVKTAVQIRSTGASKVAPEEYGTVISPKYISASPADFLAARNKSGHREYLTQHNIDDLAKIEATGGELLLSPNGKTGGLITAEGDFQNVFNTGDKGAGSEFIKTALESGKVKTLDVFEGPVADLYRKLGLKEVKSIPFDEQYAPKGWETSLKHKPNVVFFKKAEESEADYVKDETLRTATERLAPIHPDVAQEVALNELVQAERKAQGSRIVTPNDVSRAIGRDLLPNEEAALNVEGMKDYTSHVFGLAEQASAVKNKVMDEISKFRGGQLESEEQIKYFFENYIAIAAKMENTLEESARALQAGGQVDVKIITKQAELLKMQQEQAESFKPGTPLTGTQIARMIDTLGIGRATQAVKNAQRLGWDMITSHIYFSELSNPRTWEVNTGVSSFVMPFIQAASIGIGSRLSPKILSETSVEAGQLSHYAPGAAEAHIVGALDGFMTSVRHVKNSWQGGGIRGLFTDLRNLSPLPYSFAESAPAINTGPTISAEHLNQFFANHEKLSWAQFDPQGVMKPLAKLLDAYGEGAHFTRQIMEAGDRMSYLINEHAHRASQAYSRAVEQGLTGDDLIKYYKEQVANPTALVQRAANENAMHDIFRERIEGGMGSLVKGLGHPAFRPIATYVRTPFNIASVGLEGWPGLNKLVGHIRADYEAGGAREQLARGRWMVGSMVTAVGAAMAANDRFTGYGPLDLQARQAWLTTHEPFSIKIRDTGTKSDWLSLKYIQPISTYMGAAADFMQMRAWEEKPETMAEWMWAPVVGFAHGISNTVFTNDLFNFLDAIQIKPHQNAEQWARSMEQYVENRAKNIASPFPSAAGKAINSFYDPIMREVRGISDAIKSTIPGWSKTLPPKLDWFGQEQKYGPAYTMLMTPLRTTDSKYDKVTNDIAKNAPQLLTLPSVVDKVELTSKDVYDFKNIRGNEVKLFGGKKMGDALLDLVNSDQYKKGTEGPHGMQAKLLSSYVAAYTKVAIAQMAKKDPRFYNLAQEFENMESLTGKKIERPGFLKIQPQ